MTDKLNDQISAFIDDELMVEESQLLVRRLCNDEALRQTAARYTLMGNALRGSLDEIRADLNGNIMRAIEAEQLPAAPAAEVARGNAWWRMAGGGAVAAAVAALAVLAIRPSEAPMSTPAVGFSAQVEQPVVPADRPVARPFTSQAALPVRRAGNPSQLESYLLRHKQYSKTTMGQGVLVYSTMATDDVQTASTPAEDPEVAPSAGDVVEQ